MKEVTRIYKKPNELRRFYLSILAPLGPLVRELWSLRSRQSRAAVRLQRPKHEMLRRAKFVSQEWKDAEDMSKDTRLSGVEFCTIAFHITPEEEKAQEAFLNELDSALPKEGTARELVMGLFEKWNFVMNGSTEKVSSDFLMLQGQQHYYWYAVRTSPVFDPTTQKQRMSIAFMLGVSRWTLGLGGGIGLKVRGFTADQASVIAMGLRAKTAEYFLKMFNPDFSYRLSGS